MLAVPPPATTLAERDLAALVDLTAHLFACPIALVGLADKDRLRFEAVCGLSGEGAPREQTFCDRTMQSGRPLVVEDLSADPRFADFALVAGAPHARFYAGTPLRSSARRGGEVIGSLCVIDTVPRHFDDAACARLVALGGLVETLLSTREMAIAAARDAERARRTAAMLERRNRQLAQAERLAAIGSWRLDLATGRLEWSDEVFAIHGLPRGEGPPLEGALTFYPEADRARIAALIDRAMRLGESYDFESDLVTATGAVRHVRAIGDVEREDERVVALIGVFQDITERHRHETALRRVANTDSLTGLPNRRLFEERLDELIATAAREDAPLALLLIDLDGFKPVNDRLGHAAGDRVLEEMAARLRGEPFAQAFAARLGGDEFVMLVSRPRDCAELPDFIREVLRELRMIAEAEGVRLPVSASLGAALFDGTQSANRLLRDADLALYAAKRAQRGTGRLHGCDEVLHPWGPAARPPLQLAQGGPALS